ncbi:hypothetical protein MLD38_012058 [Melastoma candidum]|uniref:Uncharacterized protein n=1 Tax=Melastoma candidum TaxID=119954 RepID=A0ACB9R578_9MYRT|nr:hypothetical protein MLD38_012058 [Melastoma candidum]
MVEVQNKRVILKHQLSGFMKETDFEIMVGSVKLGVGDASNAVLVKNLYLSCDPYQRSLLTTPGSVSYSAVHQPVVI